MTNLLIATSNPGKIREYADLLDAFQVDWITINELKDPPPEVEEVGKTYAENAAWKARAYQRHSNMIVLADDSGLEVDALGGEPGLHSARYAGPGASDADRRKLLLHNLRDVPPPRTARFRCAIAVAGTTGEVQLAEGVCPGEIALEERGTNGFGYDPIFYLPDHGRTMAELPAEVKNRVSHRGRALQAARPLILEALRKAR